jgi:hypothetical protein
MLWLFTCMLVRFVACASVLLQLSVAAASNSRVCVKQSTVNPCRCPYYRGSQFYGSRGLQATCNRLSQCRGEHCNVKKRWHGPAWRLRIFAAKCQTKLCKGSDVTPTRARAVEYLIGVGRTSALADC